MAVDIEYVKSETEKLWVQIEESWVRRIPRAVSVSGIWPFSGEVFWNCDLGNRLALIRSTNITVCWRVLLEVAIDLWWSTNLAGWTAPEVISWQRMWRSVRGIDNP